MRLGISVLGIAGVCFYSSFALAGESGIQSMTPSYRSVVSFMEGYASINAGSHDSYLSDDDNIYTYRSSKDGHNDGFIGGFIGLEHPLPWYNVLVQAGVEYSYFGPLTVHGFNTVGVEPETSTLYSYQYRFQTQQVLASAKFLMTTHERYHPYASVGLGAAFNDVGRFRAATAETGNLNSTASFRDNNQSQFSYSLGAGVDVDVNQNVRVGLGYRFSGFGDASFKGGHIVAGDYIAPVPFTYGIRTLYANQLVAQISYII
ncbi:outer membrane protein [Legionella lytica]|uniref:Outer membrane protein n=1 Tax=Legionella lytica TaxID=96232 RepID=A0ABW8D5R1_9GAMM